MPKISGETPALHAPQGIRERSERLNRCGNSHVGRQPAAIMIDGV
ncbi:hypothetical protein ACRAWG_17030 [Methylobacterium sp. P31]